MNRESKKRIGMAEKLCESLKKSLRGNLISFAVFGSTARGKAKKESDIDILMIVKQKDIARKIYIKEKLKIEGVFPPYFSSVIVTEKDLKENPYILLDIIEDGIIIYDKNRTLKRMLSRLEKLLKKLNAKRIWIDENTWYWDLKPDWKPGEVVEIKL